MINQYEWEWLAIDPFQVVDVKLRYRSPLTTNQTFSWDTGVPSTRSQSEVCELRICLQRMEGEPSTRAAGLGVFDTVFKMKTYGGVHTHTHTQKNIGP